MTNLTVVLRGRSWNVLAHTAPKSPSFWQPSASSPYWLMMLRGPSGANTVLLLGMQPVVTQLPARPSRTWPIRGLHGRISEAPIRSCPPGTTYFIGSCRATVITQYTAPNGIGPNGGLEARISQAPIRSCPPGTIKYLGRCRPIYFYRISESLGNCRSCRDKLTFAQIDYFAMSFQEHLAKRSVRILKNRSDFFIPKDEARE
ncbi:hypothetical protein J437_LFUL001508 [Ladona fulva]|uniref:Uncharacterized protein n=1 Tax=Ladona fulva TaxID=123851 RepID=A0A8K0NVZ2_LADFU|nr:hypothetical protein J437_LFUL001508 [Ladona fulva]